MNVDLVDYVCFVTEDQKMRKFKIHFTIKGEEDYFIISGETAKEIQHKAKIECDKRGLDHELNNLWSEEL
jgi:hypothetical protein